MTTENQQKGGEPTREEVIAWYKSQIELASLRAELSELQTRAVKAEAERAQAAMFLAQIEEARKEAGLSDSEVEGGA